MNNLQKLLDERWPLNEAESEEARNQYLFARKVFEEGWVAHHSEEWHQRYLKSLGDYETTTTPINF